MRKKEPTDARWPDAVAANVQVTQHMQALYDDYFASKDYSKRYPQPNLATIEFLLKHGAGQAQRILDFGCGNGRYALAMLKVSQALITGYDISTSALVEFQTHLLHHADTNRVKLTHELATLTQENTTFDLVMMLFGVLSHVGDQQARLHTLHQLRKLMPPHGKLLLSVPCLWRRRPFELIPAALARLSRRANGFLAESGNIVFSRQLAGEEHQFFYHLYTVQALKTELHAAGFQTVLCEAESLLPEWLVTQHTRLGRLDAQVCRLLPAALGYGLRVVATPL